MPKFKTISRRRLLQSSASALLLANLWPGTLRAAEVNAGKFHFIIVNDLHCVDDKCHPYFEKVVASMKSGKQKIDLCIIAGDLADGGTTDQLGAVRDLFKPVAPALHVVCGNHDFDADNTRNAYEDLFAKSLNYTFDHKGWQFLALDTTQGLSANATIQKPTLEYLDEVLPKLDKKRPLILYTHFPLGPKVNMRPPNADDLLGRLKEYNLRSVFGGHYHALTERKVNDILMTTNRCCSFRRNNHDGSKEKGYFICEVNDGKVTREFVEVPIG